MLALEHSPEVGSRCASKAELSVGAKDISFHDVDAGSVLIQVRIRNVGGSLSTPTVMRLESAVLGAFVPWRPLAILPVPALEPGESRVLSVKAPRPRPAVLGDFDRVPPSTLLAAVNSPDEPSSKAKARVTTIFDWLDLPRTRRAETRTTQRTPTLAPDLMDLLGRGNPHWAGNINVFVGRTAVERHTARALRVYPGRPNLAMFMVGGGTYEAYSFEVTGLASEWQSELHDVTRRKTLVVSNSDEPIQKSQWFESSGGMVVMLMTHPPKGCTKGKVEVRVQCKSSQKTAVVEFDLDATAQGPGCYTV